MIETRLVKNTETLNQSKQSSPRTYKADFQKKIILKIKDSHMTSFNFKFYEDMTAKILLVKKIRDDKKKYFCEPRCLSKLFL